MHPSAILVRDDGRLTIIRFKQLLKHHVGSSVIPSGIVTFLSLTQSWKQLGAK
jgi:hypothetical protein